MARKPGKDEADGIKLICRNRRAFHEYDIQDTIECGLELTGTEVKSLRDGYATLHEIGAVDAEYQLTNIGRALAKLPVEQKKSIELAYFSGYSQSEIANLMGVPLGTVKGRMRIGMQKLKALLERPELGVTGA